MQRCILLIACSLLLTGCGYATPRFQTRSYALVRPNVEMPLIEAVIDDEVVRIGPRRFGRAVDRSGGTFEALISPAEDIAIVRTTERGHDEIREALARSRDDFEQVRGRQ